MSNNIVFFDSLNDQIDDGGIWNPLLVSPVAWYDASDASTITFGTGNNVAQWDDKSGNEYHMSQGSSSKQPEWGKEGIQINGMNVIHYADTLAQMLIDIPSEIDLTQFSILGVGESKSSGDSPAMGYVRSDDSTDFLDFNLQCNDTQGRINTSFKIDNSSYNPTTGYTTELADDNPFVVSVWYDGAENVSRVNGGTVSATNTSAPDGATFSIKRIQCGRQSNTPKNWQGEYIILNTADIATIEKCEGYLAWKWGLQGSLDISHPYKGNAP